MKVVVIGGGWAGCAAALSAAKQGAEVMLAERTDMLLGTGWSEEFSATTAALPPPRRPSPWAVANCLS